MRFQTGVSATVSRRPKVTTITFPNPTTPPEVRIDVGGLGMWFSEAEAADLGQQLLDAAASIRAGEESQ